jgi:hypothetical protein
MKQSFKTAWAEDLRTCGWPLDGHCRSLVIFLHGHVLGVAVGYNDSPRSSTKWQRYETLPETDQRPFWEKHWAVAWARDIGFDPRKSSNPLMIEIMRLVSEGCHVYVDLLGE